MTGNLIKKKKEEVDAKHVSYSTFKVRVYALYGYHREKDTSLTHHNCITVLITYWKQVNHDEKLI